MAKGSSTDAKKSRMARSPLRLGPVASLKRDDVQVPLSESSRSMLEQGFLFRPAGVRSFGELGNCIVKGPILSGASKESPPPQMMAPDAIVVFVGVFG